MKASESTSTQESSFQLFRLPKEKSVLDFVLQKLGDGSSPERYEIIESILEMYRTSTGFDPFAMSKGRFKRLKAADFRTSLSEIDKEIGQLTQSDEYKIFISEKSNLAPLFQEYLDLSKSVQVHPALSLTDELEVLESICANMESEEILLNFYRQQAVFLEEVYRTEGIEKLLDKYDALSAKQIQRQRAVRLGFELIQLEQSAAKGMHKDDQVLKVYEELGTLLTQSQSTRNKYHITLKIIRAALLTASPYRYLAGYLNFIQDSHLDIIHYIPECRRNIFTVLAQYGINNNKEQRLLWLDEAEKQVRQQELQDERPGLKFIRCIIEVDAGEIDAAIKALNETEHLIYKASTRSLSSRNNWIRLSEYRSLLFSLKVLQGESIASEQFAQVQQLAEDMGKHRQEIAVMILEWKGLQYISANQKEEAFNNFERARSYRNNKGDHPWEVFDNFFCAFLGKSKNKNETAKYALLLKEMNEPFYSAVMGAIISIASSIKFKKEITSSTS